jgi:hypothetical protein
LATLVLLFMVVPARAGEPTQAAREAAEYVMKKFESEAAQEGVEVLARRFSDAAARHGDEVYEAVRQVGPRAVTIAEQTGEHAPQALKLMARRGNDAAKVLSGPTGRGLFAKYGDDAVEVMIRHSEEVVVPVAQAYDQVGLDALKAVNQGVNGRRVAMLASEELREKIPPEQKRELLKVVGRYGDRAMEFIWKNKGPLATAAVLLAFVHDPEPFINGTRDLASVATDGVVKLAGGAADAVVKPLVSEVAQRTNWTLVIMVIVGLVGVPAVVKLLLRRRSREAK